MVLTKCLFRRENSDGLTFILHRFIWVAIYPGLYLVHSINEKVESTLPLIFTGFSVLIIITVLSFIIQKKTWSF